MHPYFVRQASADKNIGSSAPSETIDSRRSKSSNTGDSMIKKEAMTEVGEEESTQDKHYHLASPKDRRISSAVSSEQQKYSDSTFSPTNVESIKTSYDQNLLLSITKPTCPPHNTPVHSPSSSPPSEEEVQFSKQQNNNNNNMSLAGAANDSYSPKSSSAAVATGISHQIAPWRDGGCVPPKGREDRAARKNTSNNNNSHNSNNNNNNNSSDNDRSNSNSNAQSNNGHGNGSVGANSMHTKGHVSESDGQTESSAQISIISRGNVFTTSNSRGITTGMDGSGENSVPRSIGPFSGSARSLTHSRSASISNAEANRAIALLARQSIAESSGAGTSRGNSSGSVGSYEAGNAAKTGTTGMAPQKFYFDNDRSITDPNVAHEHSDQKITISSWLNSRRGDEIYSLLDTTSRYHDAGGRTGGRLRDRYSISGDLISPQPPKSALSMSSSIGSRQAYALENLTDSTSSNRSNSSGTVTTGANITTHDARNELPPFIQAGLNARNAHRKSLPERLDGSSESNSKSSGKNGTKQNYNIRSPGSNSNDDDDFIPPAPPKYINSKLDEIRTKLLLNTKPEPSSRVDEDLGEAAAVLSNMRSSPYRFLERAASFGGTSRPVSASFSVKGYPRPVIRIHQREFGGPGQFTGSAVSDDDEEDDMEEDMEEEEEEELDIGDVDDKNDEDYEDGAYTTRKKTPRGNQKKRPVIKPETDKFREVIWNKNGKRINGRASAPKLRTKRSKNSKKTLQFSNTNINNSEYNNNSVKAEEDDMALQEVGQLSSSGTTPEDEGQDTQKKGKTSKSKSAQQKKGSSGTRSRQGCWICRLRKKKCTEERPECSNCQRLNLQCYYDFQKPDFVSDPEKKQQKLEEIKKQTKEAKRNAMKKKPMKAEA